MKILSLLFTFLILASAAPQAQASTLWSGIIDPSRAVDWSQVGVPGGIPNRTTICTTLGTAGELPTFVQNVTAAQIDSAIQSCPAGEVVYLNPGTYDISGGITFNDTSNVTLRGAGADQTLLVFSSNNGCLGYYADVCLPSGDVDWNGGPSNTANWTAGYAPGTTSITLDSKANLAVGTPVILDELDDYSQLFTSGWTLDTGNIWEVSDTTQPTTGYFNSTIGTKVSSVAAITAPDDWYWANNILYGYSTSNPATAFTALGPSVTGDNGDIFVCYTPQYVCGTNGDSGGAPRVGRSQQQIVAVTSISGSGPYTIGISPAIRLPNWSAGKTPQAWWSSGPISMSGVENLSMDHSASEPDAGTGVGVGIINCNSCWISGVRSIHAGRSHVYIGGSIHATVQNNYFYLTSGQTSTSYGVEVIPSADSLVQNNIYQQISEPMPVNGTCSGCVYAYNFDIDNQYGSPGNYDWEMGGSMIHAVGAADILIEGNQGAGLDSDIIHGSHYMITAFRNYWNGYQQDSGQEPTGNTTPVIMNAFSRFENIIGNVLGTKGYHTNYELDVSNSTVSVPNNSEIFQIGAGDETPNDNNVDRTLMRWGNYDTVTGAVRWCGNSSDTGWSTTCGSTSEVPSGITNYSNPVPASTTLPPSFYLSAEPSWWPSSKPWPAIGPDVSGGNMPNLAGYAYSIPAADCYSNIMGGTANGTGNVLSFNANTCYGNSASSVAYGDLNGAANGAVSIYDAELVAQYVVGLVTLTPTQLQEAEVSSSTETTPTIYDAFLIAEYAVGLITQFPVQ